MTPNTTPTTDTTPARAAGAARRTLRVERLMLAAALVFASLAFLRSGPSPEAIAQSGTPAADQSPPRIAVCAAVKIVDELMESPRFKPARVELEERLRADKLRPLMDQMTALRQEAEGMGQDDPRLPELRERVGRLQREGERATREVVQQVEAKVAEQLRECFSLVRASAQAVADERGFTFVLASGDPDDAPKTDVVMRVMRDMLSRPVLVAPEAADITEEVRLDLKLE
jgi:Skp family chaperone for outer membrane proteins